MFLALHVASIEHVSDTHVLATIIVNTRIQIVSQSYQCLRIHFIVAVCSKCRDTMESCASLLFYTDGVLFITRIESSSISFLHILLMLYIFMD